MAKFNVPDYGVLTLHFEFEGQGWSEKFNLRDPDADTAGEFINYATVKANAVLIRDARQALMPLNCRLIWGKVSSAARLRDSIPLVTGAALTGVLLDAEGALDPAHNVSSGLMYRLSTAEGKWANRLIRCVRDVWISNQFIATITATPPLKTDAPVAIVGGMAAQDAVNHFLIRLMNLTYIARATEDPSLPFQLESFEEVAYRKVANRDTGSPFGVSRGRQAVAE